MRTNRLRSIFVRIVFVAAALVLLAAPAADAKRTTSLGLKKLTLATGGPEDYLFTAGNTVAGQATLDPTALASRFQVFDPNGNPIVTTPCTLPNRKRTAAGTYTIQPADPTSTGTAWKFQLQQFGNTGCTGNGYSTADLYFDVAKATSFAPGSPPSTQKSIFPAGGSAYVRVAGVGAVKSTSANTLTPLWSTSWVLPSGGTACANTGVNRPSASATGSFPLTSVAPGNAQSFLEYAPNGYNGDGFNQPASYTSACPAFAAGNQGQWQVKLQKDATHFVTLPAFTVDTTAPDTTITSAPSGTQNTNTASFQFTSTDALATFQCAQVDPGGGAPVYSSCTSPKNYNGLPQGSHTFYVRSVDQAGNVDASSASVTWSVDTVGPAVTLTAPAAAAQLNDPTPVLSGAAGNVGGISPDSTTVTVEIYQGTMPGLGSPYRSFTVTRAGAAWSVQHTTWTTQSQSALPDGTYVAVAKQKDAVNNEASSDSHVFFVDTQAPTVTVLHPTGGQSAGTGTPNMDGTAGTASTDTSSVTVEIFSGTTTGGAPARSFTPPVTGGVWAVDSGVWDSTTPLPEGTWTVRASQADAAGNTGTSFARTFTVDTTAPTTTITSGPGSPTSDTAASFGFTSNETGATFQCAIDGGVTPTLTACASPKAYSGLLPGVHTFQVQAVDAAGNVDATPATWTWTIDTTVPAVTIGSPADGLVTSDSTPAIGGTAGTATGDTSTVTVKVATAAAPGTAVRTLTTTADSSGAWSLTVVPALPDGIYLYHAEQSDSVPLTGFSATRTLTVDTTPPTTTITQAPTSPTAATQATLRFSSNKAGSTFQCRRDGAAYANCTSPVTYTGLGQGAHTFDVRATDTAGNVDNVGATATWTVNSALPNVSLATPADGLVTNNRSVSFSGTAGTNVAGGDATTLTVKIYRLVSGGAPQFVQSQANVTINSSNGSWSTVAFPVLDDGGYVAHAEQVNTVTGTGSSADRTFTVDATPPDTTVSGGPPGLTSSTTATFQPGSSEASSTYECNLDGGAWIACSNPINVVTLLNSGSPLSDGQHTLLVRATDAA
ncbi:MAG: Ig-like domain-containing protein, partial [Thermoleophilaceae bacterium]